jgi:biopolymer transport protein ExbD
MFLLLIFFMVSSTFRQQEGIEIALPKASTATQQEADIHEITVNEEGRLFFGETPVSEEGLRTAITALLAEDPEAAIVLRSHEGADFGHAIRVVDIARDVGGSRLTIRTKPLDGNAQTNGPRP